MNKYELNNIYTWTPINEKSSIISVDKLSEWIGDYIIGEAVTFIVSMQF